MRARLDRDSIRRRHEMTRQPTRHQLVDSRSPPDGSNDSGSENSASSQGPEGLLEPAGLAPPLGVRRWARDVSTVLVIMRTSLRRRPPANLTGRGGALTRILYSLNNIGSTPSPASSACGCTEGSGGRANREMRTEAGGGPLRRTCCCRSTSFASRCPPLRERPEDVAVLGGALLARRA